MEFKYVEGYCCSIELPNCSFKHEFENAISQIQQISEDLDGKRYLGKIHDIKCWGIPGERPINYALISWDWERV